MAFFKPRALWACLCLISAPIGADPALSEADCTQSAAPKFSFSIVDDSTQAAFEAFYAADLSDDGKANRDARWYLALLAHLARTRPQDLDPATFVVYRWFPYEYIQGAEDAPEIRVFLKQKPLVNPDGVSTRHAPEGAVIYLPMHGQAADAQEASGQFVEHVCKMRAKLHGAVQEI